MGKKLTALLLALSMLLPAGVFAATTYSITVTLAGPDHYGVQQKVERTSSKYGTLRDPVLGTVAQTLYLGDDTGMTVDEEVEEKYDGTLLRGEYYALSKAAMAVMDGETGAWTAWVNTYVSTAAQKRALLNTASTFADLADAGGLIYATYEGGDVDGGEGKDYTDVNDNYWAWYDIQEASTEHEHEREKSFYHEFWDDVWTEKLKS